MSINMLFFWCWRQFYWKNYFGNQLLPFPWILCFTTMITSSELKHHDACLCSQSLFPHLVCCSYLVQKLEIYSSKCIHVHNKLSFFSHLTRKDYITTQRNGLVEVGFEFEPLGMMVVGRSFSPFYSAKKKACISMLYLKWDTCVTQSLAGYGLIWKASAPLLPSSMCLFW